LKVKTPILEIKNLSIHLKKNPSIKIVDNISFKLFENEIFGIIGESGSGKTLISMSILNLLNMNDFLISGNIQFESENLLGIEGRNIRNIRGNKIAMVFQEPMTALNPTMKIGKQIIESYKTHFSNNLIEIESKINFLLKKTGLNSISNLNEKYPHEISGGQQQRVMLIMALSCSPKILIADEPTTALDVTIQKEIILILKELQKTERLSVIFISHDLGLVKKFTERLLILKKGRIIEQGKNKLIFKSPKEKYTKELISLNSKNIKIKFSDNKNQKILSVKNLYKYYSTSKSLFSSKNDFCALKNLNFDIFEGETLGVIGESGSGKSTLSNILLKICDIDHGNIYYKENEISKLNGKKLDKFRNQVQAIFQDPSASLNPNQTVEKILSEGIHYHKILESKKEIKFRVTELLDNVNLDESYLERYPHQLSGGQKQRVCIARAISLNPKLIICDEAVSALDISTQNTIIKLLNKLKKQLKLSYLFITHDLSIARLIADRILVLKKGEIVELNTVEKIFKSPKNRYTKKLISAMDF